MGITPEEMKEQIMKAALFRILRLTSSTGGAQALLKDHQWTARQALFLTVDIDNGASVLMPQWARQELDIVARVE